LKHAVAAFWLAVMAIIAGTTVEVRRWCDALEPPPQGTSHALAPGIRWSPAGPQAEWILRPSSLWAGWPQIAFA